MLLNCGVGEDSWESLGLQGDQTSNTKGNQSWIFIRRTDAEAESPILWPPDVKSQLIRKDMNSGKVEGRKRRGQQRTRRLDGITDSMDMSLSKLQERRRQWHPTPVLLPGKSQGWRSLVGCSPWGRKGSDTTERLHFIGQMKCWGVRAKSTSNA